MYSLCLHLSAWEQDAQRVEMEENGTSSAPFPSSTDIQTYSITYTNSEAGCLIQADYGEGNVINYTYDKAGNLPSRTILIKKLADFPRGQRGLF